MTTNLQAEYDAIKSHAAELAGGLQDIPRRATILHHLYNDSGGNHVFSLIAAHGALWAFRYFETGGSLGRLMSYRYFYNSKERAFRLGLLNSFAEQFREVNRQVCVDTWTNYHFTKRFGAEPGAEKVVPEPLLSALNQVHDASQQGEELSAEAKREVFSASFQCEQEITVAPGVKQAVAGFDCPILKILILRPLVRFSYFPRTRFFFFKDFSNTDERIEKGVQAFQFAAGAGWNRVVQSMQQYRVLPSDYFENPDAHYAAIANGC